MSVSWYLREKRIFTGDYAIEHGNWATGRPDSPINLPAICNACHGHGPRGIPLEMFSRLLPLVRRCGAASIVVQNCFRVQ